MDNENNNQSDPIGRLDGANLIFSQSWWNQLPLVTCALLLAVGMGYLTQKFPAQTIIPISVNSWVIDFSYLALIPLIVLAKAAFKIYNERFVLSPEYMIHITGRISWRERSVRLEYGRIQEIEIDQTILQRILGLGDVIIIPIAGTTQTTIHMHGVSSPRGVKDEIRRMQNAIG